MSDSAPREAAQAVPEHTGAEHQEDAEPAEPAHAAAQAAPPGADADAAKPDMDEVKRKFRAALDKKHEANAHGSGAGGRNTGKIHGTHGSEDHRRSFRRKSG